MFSLYVHGDSEVRLTHDTFEELASLTVKINTTCLSDSDYLLGSLISRNKRKFVNKTVAKLFDFLSTLFEHH